MDESAGPSGFGLLLECSEMLTSDSPSTSQFHETAQNQPRMSFMRRQNTTDRLLNNNYRSSIFNQIDPNIQLDYRSLMNLMQSEEYFQSNYHYFTAVQEHIQPYHREQAVEWIFDVAREEKCDGDVFLQAVQLIDRFLSYQNIFKHDIQMLAGVALFVASKLKMAHPLNATKIAYYADDSLKVDDILSWELMVVNQLQWETESPTAFDFFDQLTARLPAISMIRERFQETVHKCQKMHKLATLFPSMQCAVVLHYIAATSTNIDAIFAMNLKQLISTTFQLQENLMDSYIAMIQKCQSGEPIYPPPEQPLVTQHTPPTMFAPSSSVDNLTPNDDEEDDEDGEDLDAQLEKYHQELVMVHEKNLRLPMTPLNDSGFSSDVSSPSNSAEKKRKHPLSDYNDESPPKMLRIM